jgi:hypothetical protein
MVRFRISLLFLGAMMYANEETCSDGCITTVVVQDCDGTGVAGAHVRIKLCCGGGSEEEGTTNDNGSVTFPYCFKDICNSQVSLAGTGIEKSVDRDNCKNSGKASTCTIKVCSSRPINGMGNLR